MSYKPSYHMTNEQSTELQQVFDLFDKENTGTIRTKDLGAAMRAIGQYPNDPDLWAMMAEADPEKTGQLKYPEFLAAMTRQLQSSDVDEELRAAFRYFDPYNQGWISARDLRYFLTHLGDKLSVTEMNELIREADSNGTGQIHYADFVSMLASMK